jgi:hypothetical protein
MKLILGILMGGVCGVLSVLGYQQQGGILGLAIIATIITGAIAATEVCENWKQ